MELKRTIFVLSTTLVVFAAVFAVLVLYPVRKAEATPNLCPKLNATLDGNYGLWAPGTYVSPYASPSTGWDFSMLANFDGSGTFNGSHVYAVRGSGYGSRKRRELFGCRVQRGSGLQVHCEHHQIGGLHGAPFG